MTALLKHYVEALHLNPNKPFPSQIQQGKEAVLIRQASYPNGKGSVVLLFKKKDART
jgi:hypothetical protein